MKIELKGDTLILSFNPGTERDALTKVRALPSRRFDASSGTWMAPHNRETWEAMRALGLDTTGLLEPRATGYAVTAHRGLLRIKTPFSPENADKLRRLPDYRMYEADGHVWFAKPTRRNVEYLEAMFPGLEWDERAAEWRDEFAAHLRAGAALATDKAKALAALEAAAADDYKHGGPVPFDWQRKCFLLSRDLPAFAIFAEQRTGKTKVFIDTAAYNYTRGVVRQALVIAPNSVKTQWVTDELPEHMPPYIKWRAAYWQSSPRKAEAAALDAVFDGSDDEMVWLVMNVEALSTEKGAKAALWFVRHAKTAICVDENRIKTPRASRTRAVIALRKHAPIRRYMSGTPVTQGPLDLYAPFQYLDPAILGFGSFYAFRNHYALMGGWNGKVVVSWQRLDELQRVIDPFSFRVTRDECFDIPPKGYQKLVVDMTAEQQRVYNEMRDRMRTTLEGQKVTAQLVIVQMLRLAQIAGGFAAVKDEDTGANEAKAIPGGNPKIDALVELAGEVQGKMLVWSRFRAEIAAAADALRKEFGDGAVVEFHGGVNDDDRIKARAAFQDPGSAVRFFVGQTQTGGIGINLDQARTIAYLSNSFSLEDRLQSEDRPMTSRQRHSVAVVDIIARGTVDELVVGALRGKQDVARKITGDAWKEWI